MTAPLATRHAALRWVGLPLFVLGLALLVAAIVAVVGGAPWTRIPLAMLATGLGLGSFGANNDTALATALKVQESGGRDLAPALAAELSAELARDRAGVLALHASPRTGLVLPVVALVLDAWLIGLLVA